jgi:MFS superfamily sulfate permease-like transporter
MKENFNNYLKHYRSDLTSGVVVFLVALPLCLGIALASGAPLFSGIIAGVIGGIFVGLLSGSQTSVSGPAAGLTVIVLNAITELGTFELFLTAVVLAGLFQLALGYLKAGIIGLYFPSAVIRGMLAAIGLILILKQIPHFFGVDTDAFNELSVWGEGGGLMIQNVLAAFSHIHLGALAAGALSLSILLAWDSPRLRSQKLFRILPGALVAVLAGILLNTVFINFFPSMGIKADHLVNLPILHDKEALASAIAFPDWTGLFNPLVWKVAVVIALIASLETLLSIEAVDKLDPEKRHTPNNRELKAQGVGNFLSGLVGGLPMTAVIVRSSANIDSGAKTKMSAVYHAVLLLVCVLLIPGMLNLIPLSTLAAVLLVVGYKLSKPKLYKEHYSLGWNQFLPFIITITAILATDLLVGIIIGLTVGVFFILRANYKTPYFYHADEHPENGRKHITLTLSEHVSFLNKASLQLTLDHLPEDSVVTIDGSLCQDIDYDALVIIKGFVENAKSRGIELHLVDIPGIEIEPRVSRPVLNEKKRPAMVVN